MYATIMEVILTWPFILSAVGLGLCFEYFDWRGPTVVALIVAAVTAYVKFAVPVNHLLLYGLLYVGVGIIYSVWRYRRYVEYEVSEATKRKFQSWDSYSQSKLLTNLKPAENVGRISGWAVCWPFGLVVNATSDILEMVETFIKYVFNSVYEYLYNKAIGKLPIKEAAGSE